MFRNDFFHLAAIGILFVLWLLALPPDLAVARQRPNVIVFLSDDQGFGDFSFTGNRDLSTPHIDGLARDGAFASNFFVCPVCSPTRAEFLTGRYHPRGGVFSTSAGGERLDLDESTIAEAFQAAGYATAAFGKWHNGMQAPYHPNSRGFDEYYGFCSGHWGNYFSPMLDHNGELVTGNGFVIDDFTNHAIEFIKSHRDQPFFAYLPYNTPHSPMQVPDEYWNKFKDKEISQPPSGPPKKQNQSIDHTRAALAMCENIDTNVGRVLETLDELNLADNTIVIYFCDNGPNGPRFNAGLKGRKGSTDEGGVRSPLFIRWPRQIKAGTKVADVTGAIDLFPTLTALCGIEAKPNKPFDGRSFHPQLLGSDAKPLARHFFSHWNNKVSVRTEQYRLDHQNVLYDILADPGQQQPVKNKPAVKQALTAAVEAWRASVLAELDRSQRLFPIGHRSMKNTQLPARDAIATGQIQRSNRFPNDSYFTHWIDPADTISWPVDVVEAGRFQVQLYYCCDQANVGTTLELSLGQQKLTAKVSEANESEELGAEQDRAVRMESYVKNFKPLDMGVIELPAGAGELVLKTMDMPGDESIEFRLLLFRRIE